MGGTIRAIAAILGLLLFGFATLNIQGPYVAQTFSMIRSEGPYYRIESLQWSPDQQEIAFLQQTSGFDYARRSVYIVRQDGSSPRIVPARLAPEWWVAPTTDRRVYSLEASTEDGSKKAGVQAGEIPQLYVQNATDEKAQRVFPLVLLEHIDCPRFSGIEDAVEIVAVFSNADTSGESFSFPVQLNVDSSYVLKVQPAAAQEVVIAPGEESELRWQLIFLEKAEVESIETISNYDLTIRAKTEPSFFPFVGHSEGILGSCLASILSPVIYNFNQRQEQLFFASLMLLGIGLCGPTLKYLWQIQARWQVVVIIVIFLLFNTAWWWFFLDFIN